MTKKHHRLIALAICTPLIISFASCDLFVGFAGFLGGTTPTTIGQPGGDSSGEPLTSYKPVFTFSSTAEAKSARVLTNNTLTGADYNVALGCPALAGFVDSGSILAEGSSFEVSYLGIPVTFDIHYFEDGTVDRVEKGIRYQGLSTDKSVDLLVEYDPITKNFYYEQRVFIDDPTGLIFNSPNVKSAIFYKMKGTVSEDDSILVTPQGAVFNVIGSDAMFACFKKMEYYSGLWDLAGTKKGTGIVLGDSYGPPYADMSASAGTYTKPPKNYTSADLSNVMGYIEALLSTTTPSPSGIYQLLYKVEGEESFASVKDYLGGFRWDDEVAAPTTRTAAKSRLPSPVWKGKSTF